MKMLLATWLSAATCVASAQTPLLSRMLKPTLVRSPMGGGQPLFTPAPHFSTYQIPLNLSLAAQTLEVDVLVWHIHNLTDQNFRGTIEIQMFRDFTPWSRTSLGLSEEIGTWTLDSFFIPAGEARSISCPGNTSPARAYWVRAVQWNGIQVLDQRGVMIRSSLSETRPKTAPLSAPPPGTGTGRSNKQITPPSPLPPNRPVPRPTIPVDWQREGQY